MTPVLVVLAIAVGAGGVIAVAAPNPRYAVLGGYGAAVLAALVGDPLPSPAAIVARAAGALLAGWLVWLAVRPTPRVTERSALGLAGSAAVAMVAMVAGWSCALALGTRLASLAATGAGAAPGGAAAALAAGSPVAAAALGTALALVVLAAVAVLSPRDGLRLGLGLVLLVVAAELFVAAVGVGSSDATAIAFAIFVALTGAALAAIVSVMLRQPAGLSLRDPHGHELVVHHHLPDDASQAELP